MTTITRAFTKTINNREFMNEIWTAVVLSTGDIILAVLVTTLTLLYIGQAHGNDGLRLIGPLYFLYNFFLTMRRVLQRVDSHWTIDELASKYSRDIETLKHDVTLIKNEVLIADEDDPAVMTGRFDQFIRKEN